MKKLIDSILSCTTESSNWEDTLDIFNEEFGVTASVMFSLHEFQNNRLNFIWSSFYRNVEPQSSLEIVTSGDDGDDQIAYEALFTKPSQQIYTEMELFNVKDFDDLKPSRVREITMGWGLNMRLGAALNKSGPWLDGLFCASRSENEWRVIVSDRRIDFCLPVIANTLSLSRTLRALRHRYKASLSVLDALGIAVLLVDIKGDVIEYNKQAQNIFDAEDGVSLTKEKRLQLFCYEKTQELEAMVNSANGLLQGDFQASHSQMVCERPSKKYDYLISVNSLSDGEGELEVGLKCAFVTIIDPTREDALSVEGLALLGQLSNAEVEVVRLLVKGLRTKSVAEHRNVSSNTIRTQLKAISEKLRCRSQSDIIRMAAATRIPIDDNFNKNNN